MSEKVENTFEIRLYIGSREGYHGREFSEDELVEAIGVFQGSHSEFTPVRITKTRFIDRDYNESGWELGMINYPRLPRTEHQLTKFASELAQFLLDRFKQNRITMIDSKLTKMFERQ